MLLVFLTLMMMTIIMSLIGWDEVRFIFKGRPGMMKIAGKDGDYALMMKHKLCSSRLAGGEALCRLNRSDSSMCHWVLRGG